MHQRVHAPDPVDLDERRGELDGELAAVLVERPALGPQVEARFVALERAGEQVRADRRGRRRGMIRSPIQAADRLLVAVAEGLLRRAVPVGDDALAVITTYASFITSRISWRRSASCSRSRCASRRSVMSWATVIPPTISPPSRSGDELHPEVAAA